MVFDYGNDCNNLPVEGHCSYFQFAVMMDQKFKNKAVGNTCKHVDVCFHFIWERPRSGIAES